MEPNKKLSHDAIDAFVATLFRWCDNLRPSDANETHDVAFSDEWERKQIARELHWN
ncbi:MAG TPA: hypothetical protein VGP41_17895 [Candidatus Lustribacter sp.]|jgi:hypothetical protein|nr:hypothetical protein [Candidatus Lustribacter sp.]